MDTTNYFVATKRLIKHKLRMTIAARTPIEGMAAEMTSFAKKLETDWKTEQEKLGFLSMCEWDELSSLVNLAFLEATREVRASAGSTQLVLDGLADYLVGWRPDDFLPPRAQA